MGSISSFSPTSGHSGDLIDVYGTGFTGARFTKVGGWPSSYVIVSDTHIQIGLNSGSLSGDIEIGLADLSSVTHSGFTVTEAAPTVSSFTPTSATPFQRVTITGTGFTDATAVKFGGIDVIHFDIISDTEIQAYPAVGGTDLVSVTNPGGTGSLAGFTLILKQKRLIDLPEFDRDVAADDRLYIWDNQENKLKQGTFEDLVAYLGGAGGTGGTGGTGGVETALGSPFKVRTTDEGYNYDGGDNAVTITDLRLLGKSDYIVSGSDVAGVFRNFDADRGNGQLVFDEEAGSVTIKDYQLLDSTLFDDHVCIYADGIVSAALQAYILSLKNKISVYDKAIAPIIYKPTGGGAYKGVVFAWRRPASEIPAGWQECTDFRGKILIGQDPSDVYDATTNPEALGQDVGTPLGAKIEFLTKENIPTLQSGNEFAASTGTSVQGYKKAPAGSLGKININTNASPTPISKIPPVKIVNWIEYIG